MTCDECQSMARFMLHYIHNIERVHQGMTDFNPVWDISLMKKSECRSKVYGLIVFKPGTPIPP